MPELSGSTSPHFGQGISYGGALWRISHHFVVSWSRHSRTPPNTKGVHMSIFDPAPSPWPSRMLSILRIVTGATFITFGTMKLFNIPPMPPGQPPLEILSMVGIAGILEVFGGLAFTLGLFTRPVAFVLSGEMAFAYFIGHFPQSFWP